MATDQSAQPVPRLMSLDAYRGFVMLLMASSGLALPTLARNPDVLTQFDGTAGADAWRFLWMTLDYQLSHVAWAGCSLWDLIQPSFMFMVGVALPFSLERRRVSGQPFARSLLHAVWRSFVLIALGVLLSSRVSRDVFSFTFVNVLTQIGLGYVFVFLLAGKSLRTLAVTAVAILVGYGAWFSQHPIDEAETALTKQYLTEVAHKDAAEWSQFQNWSAHWNKHTNAAAQLDRTLLNAVPRDEKAEPACNGHQFWVNSGGYQTLNFIPAIVTMIFGLMAGTILCSGLDDSGRLRWLFKAGLLCFVVSMLADTTIWPTQWLPLNLQEQLHEYSWSICPAVKRIWSPTWTVFSAGWTFWSLGVFYWLIEVRGVRRLAFPLAVVGLNSIAMYCIAQLFKGWIGESLRLTTRTIDATGLFSLNLSSYFEASTFMWAPLLDYSLRLFVMWYMCFWMYRRGISIRI